MIAQIYRHFRSGECYSFLGVARIEAVPQDSVCIAQARYSEDPSVFRAFYLRGDRFLLEQVEFDPLAGNIDYVIYQALHSNATHGDRQLWFRPYTSFFEMVDSGGTRVPQFSLVCAQRRTIPSNLPNPLSTPPLRTTEPVIPVVLPKQE